MMEPRDIVILVGQAPGRSRKRLRPGDALTGASGSRIAALARLRWSDYLRGTERRNLLARWPGAAGPKGDRFPAAAARRAAAWLRPRLAGRRVIAVGLAVGRAIEGRGGPPLAWRQSGREGKEFSLAVCPHTSGLNRWWNDRRNIRAASRFLRDALGGGSL